MDWKSILQSSEFNSVSKDLVKQSIGKKLEEQMPRIQQLFREKLGPVALSMASKDENVVMAAKLVHSALPLPLRLFVKVEDFVKFCLQHKHRLLPEEKGPHSEVRKPVAAAGLHEAHPAVEGHQMHAPEVHKSVATSDVHTTALGAEVHKAAPASVHQMDTTVVAHRLVPRIPGSVVHKPSPPPEVKQSLSELHQTTSASENHVVHAAETEKQ